MARERKLNCNTAAALRVWGAQKRALYLTESAPVASVLGKIQSERYAAGEGDPRTRQKWPEVYRGDGLLVQIAIAKLPELPRLCVSFYWVLLPSACHVPVADQAREIGIPKRSFWEQLTIGETAIDVGLQLIDSRPAWEPLLRRAA